MSYEDLQKLSDAITIFHGLSSEQMEKVFGHLEKKKYKADEWVVEEGLDARGMFIIESGCLEVWKNLGGVQKGFLLRTFKRGDCFGEMALIDIQPRSASVLAKTDSQLFYLPYEAMSSLFEEDPRLFGLLLINIAREISRRLRLTDKMVGEFILQKVGTELTY